MRRLCLSLLVLLATAATALAAPATITVGTLSRQYLIFGTATAGPEPLIIFLHGLGGTAQGVAQGTRLGLLAPQQGFIVVFPQGLADQWNHYPGGTPTPAAAARAQKAGTVVPDDVGFLKAIIANLEQQNIADPKRIYLAGLSDGGFMALRMVCDDAGQFAALGLVATGMPEPTGANCTPAKPLPVLIEKGTAEINVPFDGGPILDKEFSVWSADQLNTFFEKLDGCSTPPTTVNYPNKGKFKIDHSSWADCKAGPMEFYKIYNGPHTLFQFPPPAPTLWAFFRDHTL